MSVEDSEKHTFRFPIDTLMTMQGVANIQGTTLPGLLFMAHLRRSSFQENRQNNEKIASLMRRTAAEAQAAINIEHETFPTEELIVKMPSGTCEILGQLALKEELSSIEEYLIASFGAYVADEIGDIADASL